MDDRTNGIMRQMTTAAVLTVASFALLGILYPLVMIGLTLVLFPAQAGGSLVRTGGSVIGSDIVGQRFVLPRYFHGRPSAAGKDGYDPTATGGTNLGPTSKKLIETTRATIAALKKDNPDATDPIPMDLVTSSGSGIDPDISPEAAYYEAPRVAQARRMPLVAVRSLIATRVHLRALGFLGEPHVNVLELNRALDGQS
jgi:K+-transporting ATPase ATPase C chain